MSSHKALFNPSVFTPSENVLSEHKLSWRYWCWPDCGQAHPRRQGQGSEMISPPSRRQGTQPTSIRPVQQGVVRNNKGRQHRASPSPRPHTIFSFQKVKDEMENMLLNVVCSWNTFERWTLERAWERFWLDVACKMLVLIRRNCRDVACSLAGACPRRGRARRSPGHIACTRRELGTCMT